MRGMAFTAAIDIFAVNDHFNVRANFIRYQ